jgi:trimethylamine:corrinoid methyltransferase-like protein
MRLEALSEQEEAAVHEAALRLLEEVGVRLPAGCPVAARLRDAGLRTVGDDRLLLPRARVEAALKQAPRVVRLGARDASRTAALDGSRTFVTTDGCGASTIDMDTGERRPSLLDDVARSARLADALPNYDVYWMMVSAHDVPTPERVPREFLTALRNTTKHVQMIDMARPGEADLLVRMAAEVRDAGLAADPPVSALISVVSPLRLDPDGTEAALRFAAAGLPVAACSMPIASVTSPATAPGTLLVAHAEVVAFTTVIQILHPGAPVIYCSFPAFADARSGVANYRDPRRFWAAAAATQMGRRVHLPTFTSGELASLLMRPDLLCFGGLLEVSTLLSFDQLVIDDEILRDLRLAAAPQPIDAESLGVGVIRDVGPGGHFLIQQHTRRHIRSFVLPRYSAPERAVEPERPEAARPDPGTAARREARRLLEEHRVAPLPAGLESRLERILLEAPRPVAR